MAKKVNYRYNIGIDISKIYEIIFFILFALSGLK